MSFTHNCGAADYWGRIYCMSSGHKYWGLEPLASHEVGAYAIRHIIILHRHKVLSATAKVQRNGDQRRPGLAFVGRMARKDYTHFYFSLPEKSLAKIRRRINVPTFAWRLHRRFGQWSLAFINS